MPTNITMLIVCDIRHFSLCVGYCGRFSSISCQCNISFGHFRAKLREVMQTTKMQLLKIIGLMLLKVMLPSSTL